MCDLSSPMRDQTLAPCIGRQRPNHWTTKDVPPHLSCCWQYTFMVAALSPSAQG